MIREIRLYGDPVLREVAQPVETWDDELRALVEDLKETMYEADGIGLAAPQVGVSLRVFVYDIRDEDIPPGVLINPEIEPLEGRSRDEEGCLSIPGLNEIVERPARVRVRGTDEHGQPVDFEADALLGRCIQHETDHLNGVLFIDHLSPLKRRLALQKWSRRSE